MKKILVIAPHPDDEVLGCGGTIKKNTKMGDEVYLCVVTSAYEPEWSNFFLKNRKKEIAQSNAILGIKKTYLLNMPTVRLDSISQKQLNDEISKIILEVSPEIVYIPFGGDLNKDHRLVNEASLVAVRPIQNNSIKTVLMYEVLSETEWGIKTFAPNYYEDISSTFKVKIKSMTSYKSELRKFPHPRSLEGITMLAKKRGSEIGVNYAESFEVIRIVNL